MARVRTVDFLPEIFQTQTNKQFLSATLDQIVQEPKFSPRQGFIGWKVGPGVNPLDKYVIAESEVRNNYQLEPGVVVKNPDTGRPVDAITYPGILDALEFNGADSSRPDRLFSSDYYAFDPFIDFDKFVNFSQYYWLPNGPDDVDVFASDIAPRRNYKVDRGTFYQFSGTKGNNPVIYLLRGGNYTFEVNQPGHNFWIQSNPGVNGKLIATPNISSRDVYGVSNNGVDNGTVTFNVPKKTAQQYFYNLPQIASVDLCTTTLTPSQIQNVFLDNFLEEYPNGIDGIVDLNNRTIVFANNTADGWFLPTTFDPENTGQNGQLGSYDTTPYDAAYPIPFENRYDVWQITYNENDVGQILLQISRIKVVNNGEKFSILFGDQYASTQWYKTDNYFQQVPLLTAIQDVLYYQDSSNPGLFGEIRLVDQTGNGKYIVIDDIIGKKNYTSPNGVVFTNGLKVTFQGLTIPVNYSGQSYYVEGVGSAIKLLPVVNYVTPETYTKSQTLPYDSLPFDFGNYDANLNAPEVQDYLTINRASLDLNAWARSNRWFHVEVLRATAEYNNQPISVDNTFRGKRPILEFRPGLRLFQFGTEGKQPVDVIDFNTTDAFTEINGKTGYFVNGYKLLQGTRIIFAKDLDDNVRNRVYQVEYIVPDSVPPLISQPIINLVPTYDSAVYIDQTVVCLNGLTLQGKSFYFDGVEWVGAQDKTSVNQAPLFNVYDSTGFSLSNLTKFPSTTFTGTKLFSYGIGSGVDDTVLGFPLKYLTISNVGDIVFDNNFYNDTFIFVKDKISYTEQVSSGFVREYSSRINFTRQLGWQTAPTKLQIYQQFRFVYDGTVLVFDIQAKQDTVFPSVKVYIDGKFIDDEYYTVTTTDVGSEILILIDTPLESIIEVLILSDQTSRVGFYQVPENLSSNPTNNNSTQFTLGTIRNHYQTIAENLKQFQGSVNGSNNIRDLGNIVPYGQLLLQQSSPLTLTGYFLRNQEYQVFDALEYNSREYTNFKSKLLDAVATQDWGISTPGQILENILVNLSLGKTENSPFYWSDMLPGTQNFTENSYTTTFISTNIFNLNQVYDFTSSNYKGLNVFLNDVILTKDYDYTVSSTAPSLTITKTLTAGDVVRIQEYTNTVGTYVPNTPSKMGLYPKYKPEIILDNTYVEPRFIIRGHDGSITFAFGDIRDQVLLEFELRIFNNIKINSQIPIISSDVVPGFFRTTDFSAAEIQAILGKDFLSWTGWNKLNYRLQDYQSTNEFTWNYSNAGNKINSQPLKGAWRGIYVDFYDTQYPNSRPWELLGFSEEPTWWADKYGTGPYTGDNLVLWDDLEAGFVDDPAGSYIKPLYIRPGLTQVIPSGTEGGLLSPFYSVVGPYVSTSFKQSWQVGDLGPVEASWYNSSSYPFAVMRLLAVTKSADFFSLFVDRDLYKYEAEFDQYLYNGRFRIDPKNIQIYGNGVSKASYINWIVDYNRQLGRNSTSELTSDLENIEVRLCYRLGGFSDKQYLKFYSERSSPQSLNTSLLIPDESYSILLYKNVPFESVNYSSVIVQKTEVGYTVTGYSTLNQYFNILVSQSVGLTTTISAGGNTVTVPIEYTNNVVQIPYGYEFTNESIVCDFLLSYGKLLEQQGVSFEDRNNGYVLNWQQMCQEFLYWSSQGWEVGSIINLNPLASRVSVTKPQAVADFIRETSPNNIILDQNKLRLPVKNLIVERLENTISITSLTEKTINYINLDFVSYEQIVIIDNISSFNDLLYDPITGARQSRLFLVGYVSDEWNGTLDAQGFILNDNNIAEWRPNVRYTKGQIVTYKNRLYSANTIVQPKDTFVSSDWLLSDFARIQLGLLPNLSNKANQLANTYSRYKANLERDNDLLAYGLIGFRPREYMQALNLNDTSQVNLYAQFLGSKGTSRSAELFTFANLGKELAEYVIYENWAILAGVYGANANRRYYELILDPSVLTSNPSLIATVLPLQTSEADQTVLTEKIYKSSFPITSPDILPTTYLIENDKKLPTAGYVSEDDVDIKIFDINNIAELSSYINDIGVGTTIWAAKVNSHEWDVYEISALTPTIYLLTDNLDGTSIAFFTGQHDLAKGDIIFVRFFEATVNAAYVVLDTPTLTTISIQYSFTNNTSAIESTGIILKLTSVRVEQASDVVNLPSAADLITGARVWVDNDGQGHWEVLEKQQPFTSTTEILPNNLVVDSNFGYSVSQFEFNTGALIGAYTITAEGQIWAYNQGLTANYDLKLIITPFVSNTLDFGKSLASASSTWSIAGAPGSNSYIGYASVILRDPNTGGYSESQILIGEDQPGPGQFGDSVTISHDGRWIYVAAPLRNRVYAFGQVVNPINSIKHRIQRGQNIYSLSGLLYDTPSQLTVVLNNELLFNNTNYSIVGTNIVLAINPNDLVNQLLVITRNTSTQLDYANYIEIEPNSQTGSGSGSIWTISRLRGTYTVILVVDGINYNIGDVLTFNAGALGGGTSPANDLVITIDTVGVNGEILTYSESGSAVNNTSVFPIREFLFAATNLWSVKVVVDGVVQRPKYDYEFVTSDSSLPDSSLSDCNLVFINNPPPEATIYVTNPTYFRYAGVIARDDLSFEDKFGYNISTSTDGRHIFIGSPYSTVDGAFESGTTFVYQRLVQSFVVTDASDLEYIVTLGNIVKPHNVQLNGNYLLDSSTNYNGQFFIIGNTVTLENITLNVGDIITVDVNEFKLVQEINLNPVRQSSHFGYAVDLCVNNCSLYIGAPEDSHELVNSGSVSRFVNQVRVYGTISSTLDISTVLTPGTSITINDFEIICTGTTIESFVDDINAATIDNARASYAYTNTTATITISVVNISSSTPLNRLRLGPGVGNLWTVLDFQLYAFTQTLYSPRPIDFARFGATLNIDSTASTLVVGAPNGTTVVPVTFDNNTTIFDVKSTTFASIYTNSGAVYTFDYLPSATDSITNPGQFVFGQQIYDGVKVETYDKFGQSISYVSGVLMIGSPGDDQGDSALSEKNYGRVALFLNPKRLPAWTIIHREQPVVDIYKLNSSFIYTQVQTQAQAFLDFFNPLQGKVLGVVEQNINYVTAIDPAFYNQGSKIDQQFWTTNNLGQIWWDTTTVRFIDPGASDNIYASKKWGQVFPGSQVDIYQWISSSVPPDQYPGPGQVYSQDNYSIVVNLNLTGNFETTYYYWVKGLTSVAKNAGKNLSVSSIASYILNPKLSGISYIAPLSSSTIALYNCEQYINQPGSILHVEFDVEKNESNVHFEYQLVAQDKADSFLSNLLFRKYVDSFSGITDTGRAVPDPTLSKGNQIGVSFRPRQSMFVDRFLALKNYLQRANRILAQFPIVETKKFNLLNSAEPIPSVISNEYDFICADLAELSYQDLNIVPVGYKYLVLVDSSQNGLWTIYQVTLDKTFTLYRVQGYDTRLYWKYINWYAVGYNRFSNIILEVPLYANLLTLNVPIGTSVKVTENAQHKWEIYIYQETGWSRVALEDGTIEFRQDLWDYDVGRFGFDVEVFDAQYFDQAPNQETRKIIEALNEELYVDDLLIEKNKSLILMFNFILSETGTPEWLTKTSLIDIEHKIRNLEPFQNYRQDNQDFVLKYIQEVKPYHVQTKEFFLSYSGFDLYQGIYSDFDLPAFYDTNLSTPQFVSPVLDNTGELSTTSSFPSDSYIWQTWPYNQWFNNYKLSINTVTVVETGSGYTTPPTLIVVGEATTPAELNAVINSAGELIYVDIINPGSGYTITPDVIIKGGNGSGARLAITMTLSLVRSFTTTIKYDRYQYQADVTEWQPDVVYDNGTLVRYLDKVWSANNSDSSAVSSLTFDPDQWTLVPANQLSGVDRTMGFYVSTVNQPGLELPLLITGVEYPGVQVSAITFDLDTGFDRGPYDMAPYDNFEIGPDGKPTYSESLLDAAYYSSFGDIYLGTRPTDVNVEGGLFVGPYSSHAPEELLPGIVYDTLDLRVYTRPGSDWNGLGHGWPQDTLYYTYTSTNVVLDWSTSLVKYPATLVVTDSSLRIDLTEGENYSINWITKTIVISSGVNVGDTIVINVFGIGGGDEIYRTSVSGAIGKALTIPVPENQIEELVIFANGENYTDFTFSGTEVDTTIDFPIYWSASAFLTIVALGTTDTSYFKSWSTAVKQTIVVTDSTELTYTLTNSLANSNPDNMIVTKNGFRARPAQGVEYTSDGSSAEFYLPTRGGYSQSLIADNDVRVYINDEPLTLGSEFVVSPAAGDATRTVILSVIPDSGQQILICVSTKAEYFVSLDSSSDEITFRPNSSFGLLPGDIIDVITWNDTTEQNLITLLWQGPVTTGEVITQGYDSVPFDEADEPGPGSFDYTQGNIESFNDFQLGRDILNPSRLWVTLNGLRIFNNQDFVIQGQELILSSGVIGQFDVLVVTMYTDDVVPNELAFRIFQDMRGVQATYRITENTTTTLTSTLGQYDDIIYVENAAALPIPNLSNNIWGAITINGERIMYRQIDLINNTVSSLLRGTAGTGAAGHAVGALVYDISLDNLLFEEYQDYFVTSNTLADGVQVSFTATGLVVDLQDEVAIQVYVGGSLVTSGYLISSLDEVTILFDDPPPSGQMVTIQVKRGVSWYQPGNNTASNGIALQETNTKAARFFRNIL